MKILLWLTSKIYKTCVVVYVLRDIHSWSIVFRIRAIFMRSSLNLCRNSCAFIFLKMYIKRTRRLSTFLRKIR